MSTSGLRRTVPACLASILLAAAARIGATPAAAPHAPAVPAEAAAWLQESPGPTRARTRLVLLDAPTRWDAWAAALEDGQVAAPRKDRAAAAAARAGARIAALAAPVERSLEAAGGSVLARYDTALAGLLLRLPAGAEDRGLEATWRALPGVRAVVDPPLAVRAAALGGARSGVPDDGVRSYASSPRSPVTPGRSPLTPTPLPEVEGLRNALDGVPQITTTQAFSPLPLREGPGVRGVGPGVRGVEPGVRGVEPGVRGERPAAGRSGAEAALGDAGAGVIVAVVDTGVDYTHAAFEGPGSEAAYAEALLAPERIDDRWQGRPFFPTAVVAGGWDFAGERYAPGCAVEGPGAPCSALPEPDPDPLDRQGHGTHVAGIALGRGTRALAPGEAPAARLVALKIFGRSEQTELLTSALEWVVEANMGQGDRPKIDVLNLSLGIAYGARVLEDAGAIRRLVDSGTVVAASAGNGENLPFIAGAPAVAAHALAIASHLPPGQHVWEAELAPDGAEAVLFDENAIQHQGWSPEPTGALEAPLVFAGRACPGQPLSVDPAGAVALYQMVWGPEAETCSADAQARLLQAAGARAALMGTDLGVEQASAWSAAPTVDIPVWMVNGAFEQAVEAAAAEGRGMRVRLWPRPRPELDGVVSPFSSRGPARSLLLKPDLSAPGSGIVSAAMGQGQRGIAASGTSMAAPRVAGAAARLWSAARAWGPEPRARDLAARLVNSADPARLFRGSSDRGTPSLARMGAGALDPAAALAATDRLRAGALASLSLGLRPLTAAVTETRPISLGHASAQARRYRLATRFRAAEDAERGLALRAPQETVAVPAGAELAIPLELRIDPANLALWQLRGGAAVGDVERFGEQELDGWLEAQPLDAAGADEGPPLRLPFHLLARAAASIQPLAPLPGSGAATGEIELGNPGRFAGSAEIFTLMARDAAEPELPPKIDLDAVGVRARGDAQGYTIVEFLLHSRGPRNAPLETESLIELDIDLDGRADFRAFTGDEEWLRTESFRNGKVKVALAPVEGDLIGVPLARHYADLDIGGRYTVLPVTIDDTGLTASGLRFQFRVQQRDLVERSLEDPLFDHVPDQAAGPAWILFDGRAPAWSPARITVSLGPGARRQIPVAYGDPTRPGTGLGLMALFPANLPEADLALPTPPEPPAAYLPWAARGQPDG